MPDLPSKSMFSDNLNSRFLVDRAGDHQIELELIELRNGFSNKMGETFALLFRGPGESVLPQKIYTLKHDRLGAFDLFLVPVSRDAKGTYYEVIFNFLRNS